MSFSCDIGRIFFMAPAQNSSLVNFSDESIYFVTLGQWSWVAFFRLVDIQDQNNTIPGYKVALLKIWQLNNFISKFLVFFRNVFTVPYSRFPSKTTEIISSILSNGSWTLSVCLSVSLSLYIYIYKCHWKGSKPYPVKRTVAKHLGF